MESFTYQEFKNNINDNFPYLPYFPMFILHGCIICMVFRLKIFRAIDKFNSDNENSSDNETSNDKTSNDETSNDELENIHPSSFCTVKYLHHIRLMQMLNNENNRIYIDEYFNGPTLKNLLIFIGYYITKTYDEDRKFLGHSMTIIKYFKDKNIDLHKIVTGYKDLKDIGYGSGLSYIDYVGYDIYNYIQIEIYGKKHLTSLKELMFLDEFIKSGVVNEIIKNEIEFLELMIKINYFVVVSDNISKDGLTLIDVMLASST